MGGYKVFVSYSENSLAVAMQVVECLESHGQRCWIYPRDVEQKEDWADEVEAAISNCESFVTVYGAEVETSVRIPKEVGLASSAGKRIIQFKLDDTELTGALRYHLIDSVAINVAWDMDKKLEELTRMVERLSGEIGELYQDSMDGGQGENAQLNGEKILQTGDPQPRAFVALMQSWKSRVAEKASQMLVGLKKRKKAVVSIAIVICLAAAGGAGVGIISNIGRSASSYSYMSVYFYPAVDGIGEAQSKDMQKALIGRLDEHYGSGGYKKEIEGDEFLAKIPSADIETEDLDEGLRQLAGEDYLYYRTVPAIWMNKRDDPFCGEYQCNVSELEGQLIDALYDSYDAEKEGGVSEGDWYDTNVLLRSRLDLLGIPYAIGWQAGQERSIVVRLGMEKVNSAMLGLMVQNTARIFDTEGNLYTGRDFQYGTNEDGSFWASIKLTDENTGMPAQGEDCVLVVSDGGDVCLLSGVRVSVDNGRDAEGKIQFNSSPFDEEGLIPQQAEQLLKLLQDVCKDGTYTGQQLGTSYSYNEGKSYAVSSSLQDFRDFKEGNVYFGLRYRQYIREGEELGERLQELLGREAGVRIDKDRTCHIMDFLTVDESFPEMIVGQTIALAEGIGMGSYPTVVIHFTEEKGEERARVLYFDVEAAGFEGMKAAMDLYLHGENVESYQVEVEERLWAESYFRENQIVPYEEYLEKATSLADHFW